MKSTRKGQNPKKKSKEKKWNKWVSEKDKEKGRQGRKRRKRQNPNMCFLVYAYRNKSIVFSFQFSLWFGKKKFWWVEKNLKLYRFYLLKFFQSNTWKNHFLSTFLLPFSIFLKSPQPNRILVTRIKFHINIEMIQLLVVLTNPKYTIKPYFIIYKYRNYGSIFYFRQKE